MNHIKLLFTLISMLVLSACSSMYDTKVSSDRNTAIDISQYKTFTWLKQNKILVPAKGLNPVMKARMEDYIEEAFINKGYKLVESEALADFTISYTVGSRDKISVNSYPVSYSVGMGRGWGRGYYGGYYGYGTDTSVRTYREGNLAIDVYDVKSHEPAWHGAGVKNISSEDKEDPGLAIKKMVNNVIGQFK